MADTFLLKLGLTGAATTGVKVTPEATAIVPANLEVVRAYAHAETAPVGAAMILNVQRTKLADGTTAQLWTTAANRPTIADGAKNSWAVTGSSPNIVSTDPASPDTTDAVEGDILNLNIVQIGSGTAGSDVSLMLLCEKN